MNQQHFSRELNKECTTKEIKSRKANKLTFRDSTPLLFSPPRIEDHQIKNSHRSEGIIQDEDRLFEESDEQLPGSLCEAAQIECPEDVNEKEKTSAHPKTTVIEFFNGHNDLNNPWFFYESQPEETHWQNTAEDDVPIFDAESTVSAMKEFVKEHLSSLVESASLTEEYADLNHMESFELSTKEDVNTQAVEICDDNDVLFVQKREEKTAALPEEPPAVKAETFVEEADECHEETMIEEEVFEEQETVWGQDRLGYSSNKTLPTVKLPVLLAVLNVDIDIFETVDLPFPVKQIMKSEWEVRSLSLQVLPPSAKVLVSGILAATIDYLHETESLNQHTITFPWKKVMEITWLYPPDLSSHQLREYMFHDRNYQEVPSHYESIKNFSDAIYFDVKQQHSVWAHELLCKNQARMLEFQGTITIVCQLLQTQLVNL